VAGVLISLETNIEPTMGMNAILKGIIASIIGGIGSIPGAVLGSFFLGMVENLGIWKIQAGWKDTIAFAVLIIFLLFRPQGILGNRKDKPTSCITFVQFVSPESFRDEKARPAIPYSPSAWPASLSAKCTKG
jgi:hypothetical protein